MEIVLLQMTSVLDYKKNLEKIEAAAKEVQKRKVKYLFLPECFYSMSDPTKPTPYLIEQGNEHYKNIKSIAQRYEIYLLAGSVAANVDGNIVNMSLNISPTGEDLGSYQKIHLFSCNIKDKKINEADIYQAGKEPKIIKAGPLKIGQSICFDLRFPELSRQYAKEGANVLTFPSAFTVHTGRDHWHILLRARAIENQCFVIAPAQYGRHNDRIVTYGYSLVVDPWGNILADAGEGEKLISAKIDLEQVDKIRNKIKTL